MTEDDAQTAERENDVARLLLRSASLDVPGADAKLDALEAGLRVLRRRTASKRRYWFGAAAVATAAAAAIALVAGAPEPVELTSEPPVATRSLAQSPAATSSTAVRKPCPELVVGLGHANLIEDWEQKDSLILRLDGRSGGWVTYDDGTGVQRPAARFPLLPSLIPGGRSGSKQALHISGTRFSNWGVTFGAELADAACYDASAYAGIEFWAKGPGRLKVGVQMIDVQSEKYGGQCKKACYNAHRRELELAPKWAKYSVPWTDLRQPEGTGEFERIALDPRRIRFLEFGVAAEHTPFDLWIDDISFLRR